MKRTHGRGRITLPCVVKSGVGVVRVSVLPMGVLRKAWLTGSFPLVKFRMSVGDIPASPTRLASTVTVSTCCQQLLGLGCLGEAWVQRWGGHLETCASELS